VGWTLRYTRQVPVLLRLKKHPWNSDLHPRDRVGQFARLSGGGQAGDKPPLSDTAYRAHTDRLQQRLDHAFRARKDTARRFTRGGDGVTYHPDRAALHKQIVDELAAKYAGVPNEGKAVISGGLGGSGKTTVLARFSGIDPSRYATINSDDIKEIMAGKGMIPRAEGVSPMESVALVHEESRHITQMAANRFYRDRKNIIWDTTMSGIETIKPMLRDMRRHGYQEIKAVFVDIPVATAIRRALARHRAGMERYRNGRGFGGRFVPPRIIKRSQSMDGDFAHNRSVFGWLKPEFDAWEMWDNSVDGRNPVLVASSKEGGGRG
jgi:adenylate kinase